MCCVVISAGVNVGPIVECQCSALPCQLCVLRWLCVQNRDLGWCDRWAHRCVPVFGIALSVVCAVLSSRLV